MATAQLPDWIQEVRFDAQGLIPALSQDFQTGDILMVAWMNADALAETVLTGRAVFWSRSRNRLWRKGEESGHVQRLVELRLDCDGDVLLLKVEQIGAIACHTGRASCFYRRLDTVSDQDAKARSQWVVVDPILKDPELIYK